MRQTILSASFKDTKPSPSKPVRPGVYLPAELIEAIAVYLSPGDLLRARSVCRTWRRAILGSPFLSIELSMLPNFGINPNLYPSGFSYAHRNVPPRGYSTVDFGCENVICYQAVLSLKANPFFPSTVEHPNGNMMYESRYRKRSYKQAKVYWRDVTTKKPKYWSYTITACQYPWHAQAIFTCDIDWHTQALSIRSIFPDVALEANLINLPIPAEIILTYSHKIDSGPLSGKYTIVIITTVQYGTLGEYLETIEWLARMQPDLAQWLALGSNIMTYGTAHQQNLSPQQAGSMPTHIQQRLLRAPTYYVYAEKEDQGKTGRRAGCKKWAMERIAAMTESLKKKMDWDQGTRG